MGITNIHDALEATEVKLVTDKLCLIAEVMISMAHNDMGHLNERQAARFIEATETVQAILTELQSGDTEHATYCAHCDATHWASDENEHNSTHQQWQCHECGQWNDKATD